ncbi:MAG: MgtC/SapB family protein [Pseudolabrys sp.]|nr:MgtC/SapB family protein [Pseudolabrys sp.]MBV9954241.1 MgtC/SapB family protein [Pseudolabrys sp.]
MTQTLVSQEDLVIILRLVTALAIGGLIGLERTMHGRPAGFRTHALVCLASALLMLVTVYQLHWMTEVPLDTIRADPTRMAQGIMTGIGFLGAGVIFKEGLNVRGLTTAASIWITAAIGILIGIGFYFPAIIGAIIVLAVLAVFRWIESQVPSEYYAHHMLRFARAKVMQEAELRRMIAKFGFSVANISSRLTDDGRSFEYHMTIRSRDHGAPDRLSQHLRRLPHVREFRITPIGD